MSSLVFAGRWYKIILMYIAGKDALASLAEYNLAAIPISMSHQALIGLRISVAVWLGRIDDPAHFPLLFVRQFNVPRGPVFFQAPRLGSARNSDHSLSSNPGESYLAGGATFARSELLDLLDNSLVFVEVFALEFGA
jgi:hypothetical protein